MLQASQELRTAWNQGLTADCDVVLGVSVTRLESAAIFLDSKRHILAHLFAGNQQPQICKPLVDDSIYFALNCRRLKLRRTIIT